MGLLPTAFEIAVDVFGPESEPVADDHCADRAAVDESVHRRTGDAKHAGELRHGEQWPNRGVVCCAVTFHTVSVAVGEPSEVGHFEPAGKHYDGTPSARALEVSMLPYIALGAALGADQTFRRYAAEVADAPERADGLAGRYARSGAGRNVMSALLLIASQAPPSALTTRLMNASRKRAVYIGQPLENTDPKNALQERFVSKLHRGAQVITRRGAHQCLQCGAHKVRGYCQSHSPLEHGQQNRDRDAARMTLRAVAEQMGIDSDGPAARRVRRRVRS